MDTFDNPALDHDIQVETASQKVIKSMVEAYVNTLSVDEATYDDFLNIFKLSVRKKHEDKLALLLEAGVDTKIIDDISNQLDRYDALLNKFTIDEWRLGHTSPVSDSAMLSLSFNRKKIIKNPELPNFIHNYLSLVTQLINDKNITKKDSREFYSEAFESSGFPKFITAKTVANSLYIIQPDAFPLINDHVLDALKDRLGHKIKLTPEGYLEASLGLDEVLTEITETPHFGVLDRVVSHQVGHDLNLDEVIDTIKNKNNTIRQFVKLPEQTSPINQILYGPPGTGKTFHTVTKAIQILDPLCYAISQENPDLEAGRRTIKKRFDELYDEGRVAMTTFHQSFSYEDFVEGIRAEADRDENGKGQGILYEVQDGIFKTICQAAKSRDAIDLDEPVSLEGKKIWKMSLGNTQNSDDDYIYPECLENNYILLGWGRSLNFKEANSKGSIKQAHIDSKQWDEKTERHSANMVHRFINDILVGDIVVISDGNKQFRAVAEVTGEYEYLQGRSSEREHFLQKRSVRWLKSYNPSRPVNQILGKLFSQKTLHSLDASINKNKLEKLLQPKDKYEDDLEHDLPYVLIIDEINRGNISRIFGELITLLEPSKREGEADQQKVKLPYSKNDFAVPANLYVIGTMNTADRSLSQIDIALRRRFKFEEMLPEPELLAEIEIEEVNVGKLLQIMNERIEILLGRDYVIGHSYFMPLAKTASLEKLAEVFKQEIIPLLQEYFFEDWEKIRLVLNDHQKKSQHQLITRGTSGNSLSVLFGDKDHELIDSRYAINTKAFEEVDSFAKIIPDDAE